MIDRRRGVIPGVMFKEMFLSLCHCHCAARRLFGGDISEHLGRCWRVQLVWCRSGPTLIELHKEERVFEGSSINNGLHEVDEGQNHAADEDEGDKWPQMVPGHPESVAQLTQPALLGGVRGAAGGRRCCGTSGRSIIGQTRNHYRIHFHVQGESEQSSCSLTTQQFQES